MVTHTTTLITGASSGFGRALARELGRRGAHVVAAARRLEALEALVRDIEQDGGRAEALSLDVADTAATVAAIQEVDRRLDGLDLVIANAGLGVAVSGKRMTFEAIEPILRVNYLGAVATLTAVLPAMVARDHGHLVGVTSLAASRGFPRHAAYCSTKAALSVFLESLRLDLRKTAVRITEVAPGFIRTPMTEPNKHPMPFIQEPDVAARFVVDRLEKGRATIRFPAQMSLASRVVRLVPDPLYAQVFGSKTGVRPEDLEEAKLSPRE